jgi:lipid II:glycine glycyltransferase (peptidoglycan interpeptide bridge formation enzyme)
LPHDFNIFNDEKYFSLHSTSSQDVFAQLVRQSDKKVFATIAFYKTDENVYVSPLRGTFGGFSLSGDLSFEEVEVFVLDVFEYLYSLGSTAVKIKCAPSSHSQKSFSVLFNILLNAGFEIHSHELNYHLTVDERPYLERINYSSKKKILKAGREGFQASKVESDELDQIYKVIKESRQKIGVNVSMSQLQVASMIELFPSKLKFFAIHKTDDNVNEMVAAAVCIAVSDEVLYVLYWGDIEGMQKHSPISLLAKHIYEFAQAQSFKQLDVGTSTLLGKANYGLVRFKRNLGFHEAIKLEFIKNN